ncbi:hypothetical protein CVT24_005383 [Panaeolus cyanescens]|uniref:DUF4360 domain-containing protein n=1 Tax=Panaeolus cyanescens TaxID=181874 RepID=A0A409Y8L8_9AGAR|nr:hypothetical protein CVT24_005383 [Panaeolus cyanescens]
MSSTRFLFSLLVGFLYLTGAIAQKYSITDYILSGTGCARGTATATISDDAKSISLKYQSFVANAGPGVADSNNRKNCQLTLVVNVPSGYQFAFNDFSYSGRYALDSGVKGQFQTDYYFQSSIDESTGTVTVAGPASNSTRTLSTTPKNLLWSPCGKSSIVGVNSSLRVDNSASGNASGSVSVTTLSIPVDSISWKQC